jgi:predicted nucleotidyltransferase
MRLSDKEIRSIVETVVGFMPDASIRLFGSRTDDAKRGGDIDLLVLTSDPQANQLHDKIMLRLHDLLGEQKIDLLIEHPESLTLFGRLAYNRSLPLGLTPTHSNE